MPLPLARPAEAPISAINTTPLIDVMLVLLIMLIITIPVAQNQVPIDLPNGPPAHAVPVTHRLAIDARGQAWWDGAAIRDADLPGRLAAARAGDPDMTLVVETDPEARYERFNALLATVRRGGVTKIGFAGNRPADF